MPLKDALPIVVAVLGILFGLLQYRSTSHDEFLKPIREAQLQLYQDASSAAATLSTAPKGSPEWKKAKGDFLRLYYGPLAIVENYEHKEGKKNEAITVERAMIAFKSCLDNTDCPNDTMLSLSLALAHTCRISLGTSWGFSDAQLQGDYQQMIRTYSDQYKGNRSLR